MNLEFIIDRSFNSFITDWILFLCITRALSISFIANWVIFSCFNLVLLTRHTLPKPPLPMAYLYSNNDLFKAINQKRNQWVNSNQNENSSSHRKCNTYMKWNFLHLLTLNYSFPYGSLLLLFNYVVSILINCLDCQEARNVFIFNNYNLI